MNLGEARIWWALVLTSVLTSGAVMFAQPILDSCRYCPYGSIICTLMGCW